MNYKKLSIAAVLTVSILMINSVGNAAQHSKGTNLLCDMGLTGYAAPIHKKQVKKHVPKKETCKPMPTRTGAACPTPCPAPCNPCTTPCEPCNPCAQPCNPCPAPCEPCNPCPTGAASPVVQPTTPCPAPYQPISPCPAPCNPCNQ